MKLTNPVGRTVVTGVDANYNMRACMCSSNMATTRAGGGVDTCAHCGCNCSGNYSYNSSAAHTTDRTSY